MKIDIELHTRYLVYCLRPIRGPINAVETCCELIGGTLSVEQARETFCCGSVDLTMNGTVSSNTCYLPGQTIDFQNEGEDWDSTFVVDRLIHCHGTSGHRPWISASRSDHHYMPFANPADSQTAPEVMIGAFDCMVEMCVSYLLKRNFKIYNLSMSQPAETPLKYFDLGSNMFPSLEQLLRKAGIEDCHFVERK